MKMGIQQLLKINKGQSLIEATVALASIILTLAAITVAVTTSVSNSTFIKNQTVAARYAQEGMEYVRQLRNNKDVCLTTKGVQPNANDTYCFNSNTASCATTFTGGACSTVNIAGSFKREVQFTQDSSDCGGGTKVVVDVFFSSNKCPASNAFCHKSELISCFSKQSTTIPAL